MKNVYDRDWQENGGYEDYLKNQINELKSKNEKVIKNGAVKLNSAMEATANKNYMRQQSQV